jgi:hypothetical protein
MKTRASVIAIVITIGGFTIGCGGARTDVPTAPTPMSADDGNTSSGGLPPNPAPPSSGTCDTAKAEFAIGQRASQALLEQARVAAGASVARFIRPNEAITLEFAPARLNLNLSGEDTVRSAYCG